MIYTKTYGKDVLEFEDPNCEEPGDLENAFRDTTDLSDEGPKDPYEFIGYAFHAMQQCGGTLLVNNEWVKPLVMDQTNGDPINPQDIVSVALFKDPDAIKYCRMREILCME